MQISKWLNNAAKQLDNASIATARLDCLVLLEDVLGTDRTQILASPDIELTLEQEKILNLQIKRRANHEPLAYIRGKSEFYGREFIVNEHTLEPRPETETMIELLKQHAGKEKNALPLTIVDVGTGSGCIAITTKLELPNVTVFATDIDEKCIDTARQNALNHDANINLLRGDLVMPLPKPANILLCNLPYVPDKYELNKAAEYEPRHAIFGGEDGLDVYRKLFTQIISQGHKPKLILTESLPFQHEELCRIAKEAKYKLKQSDDFIQVFELT